MNFLFIYFLISCSIILDTVSCQNYIQVYSSIFTDPNAAIQLNDRNLPNDVIRSNPTSWSFSAWIKLDNPLYISTLFRFRSGIPAIDHLCIFRDNSQQLKIFMKDYDKQDIILSINEFPIESYFFLYTGYSNLQNSGTFFYRLYDSSNIQNPLIGNGMSIQPIFPSNQNWDISIGKDFALLPSNGCNCLLYFRFYYSWVADINVMDKLLFSLLIYDQPTLVGFYIFGNSITIHNSSLLSAADLSLIDNTCSYQISYIECNDNQYFILPANVVDNFLPTGQICLNLYFSSLENGNPQTLINFKDFDGSESILIKALINKESFTIKYALEIGSYFDEESEIFSVSLDSWFTVCFMFMKLINNDQIFTIYHSTKYSSIVIPNIPDNELLDVAVIGSDSFGQNGFYGRIKSLAIYKNINLANLDKAETDCLSPVGFKQIYFLDSNRIFESMNSYFCLQCGSNYNYDTSVGSCQLLCHAGCSTCFGELSTNCLSCHNSYYLTTNMECVTNCSPNYAFIANKTCVNTCPEFYFANTLTNICQDCPSHCVTCLNSSICLKCSQGFWLDPSSQACEPCDISCSTCSGPFSSNCTQSSCTNGTFLFNGSCNNPCPSGFYGDDLSLICSSCNLKCKTCKGGNANDCLSCFEDSELTEGNCNDSLKTIIADLNLIHAIISLIVVCISTTLDPVNLWIWLNKNQLIYFMNFVNINLPYNLREVLDNWLYSLINFTFKFPIKTEFPIEEPNTKFLIKDINSYFFANSLTHILIIIIILILLYILDLIKDKFSGATRWLTRKFSIKNLLRKICFNLYFNLKWKVVIRFISAIHSMMCFYCYLQIYYYYITNFTDYLSYITAWFVLITLGILPIWSIRFLKKHKNQILNIRFINEYGSLYSDYRTNKYFRVIFGLFSLLWIQIFVGVIVMVYSFPFIVIISEISLLIIMVLILMIVQPYTTISINIKATFSYLLIFLSYILLMSFLYLDVDSIWAKYIGWIIISLLVLITLIDIVFLAYEIIKQNILCKVIGRSSKLFSKIFKKKKMMNYNLVNENASLTTINLKCKIQESSERVSTQNQVFG